MAGRARNVDKKGPAVGKKPEMDSPQRPRPTWLRALPFLLALLLAAAYSPVGEAEFVVWDDDDHIYENRHILAEEGWSDAWRDWRDPVAALSAVPQLLSAVRPPGGFP